MPMPGYGSLNWRLDLIPGMQCADVLFCSVVHVPKELEPAKIRMIQSISLLSSCARIIMSAHWHEGTLRTASANRHHTCTDDMVSVQQLRQQQYTISVQQLRMHALCCNCFCFCFAAFITAAPSVKLIQLPMLPHLLRLSRLDCPLTLSSHNKHLHSHIPSAALIQILPEEIDRILRNTTRQRK